MSFIDKIRERVSTLQGLLETRNFKGCANLSTDLLRTSEFANYPEGIFIGEFFESLFSNIRLLNNNYKLDSLDLESIQQVILPVIQYSQANIPITTDDKKARFYDLMLNARSAVTEMQIMYYREKIRKPTLPMNFPLPPQMNIENEEEEE